MYELRFYINKKDFDVLDTYGNPQLAYGMRKKKHAENPITWPIQRLKVVKV